MRDAMFLLLVAAAFACGYVLMDRLDRLFQRLRPEELSGEETEIFQPDQVENSCLQCYNNMCDHRVSRPAARPRQQEETTWRRQGRTQISFCRPFGMAAGRRGS